MTVDVLLPDAMKSSATTLTPFWLARSNSITHSAYVPGITRTSSPSAAAS